MPDRDETLPADTSRDVVDLTSPAPPTSAQLRDEVDQMVAEVVAATRRVAPLLADARALLAQVDRMVVDHAAAHGPGDVDERYLSASRATGHDQLFDALQALSAMSDAYVVVHDRHQAAAAAAGTSWAGAG